MTKKKIIAVLASMLLLVLVVAGCGNKSISAEKAGSLLIDRFVYDKENKDFEKAFSNAEDLEKQAKKTKDGFTEGFLSSAAGNMDLTEEDADELYNNFMAQIKSETSYKIKEVSKDKDSVELEVEVTGLDFTSVMKAYMADLQEKAMKNPDIDEDEILALVLESLGNSIKDAKATDEPVTVSLTLQKDKNKWEVDKSAMDELGTIFIATLLGVEDPNDITLED